MELQERVVQAIKSVDEKFYCEEMANFDDNERNHLLNLYRETMLKGYNFGFEVNTFLTLALIFFPLENSNILFNILKVLFIFYFVSRLS